jgi:hypothetical protein
MQLMASNQMIALFGEAEKGSFDSAYHCRTLGQLADYLGNPPPNSLGLFYAIQALLFQYELLFFRVKEEGFSLQDYIQGSRLLSATRTTYPLSAICVPGVGNKEIIEAIEPVCFYHHSVLIMNEADLYDYLTHSTKS